MAYKHLATAYSTWSDLNWNTVQQLIWDPTAKWSIDILEWVQRQSVHWALMQHGATSVTKYKLLKDLYWAELVDMNREEYLALFVKLLNGYIAVYISMKLTLIPGSCGCRIVCRPCAAGLIHGVRYSWPQNTVEETGDGLFDHWNRSRMV